MGRNHEFPSQLFSLAGPKNFVRETFCAVFQKTSASEKVYGQERGECMKIFRRKFLVAQCRKFS